MYIDIFLYTYSGSFGKFFLMKFVIFGDGSWLVRVYLEGFGPLTLHMLHFGFLT